MLEKYVENEYMELCSRYNTDAPVKKVTLRFRSEKYFRDFQKTLETNRRGEVGFLLIRKNGSFVVIRSRRYPKSAYRIPTGGINFNEKAIDALYREVAEELGVKFEIENFHGIIEYDIHYKEDVIKFYSYLFIIKEVSGNIIDDALEDEIADYKETDFQGLSALSGILERIEGGWRDWGRFRAELIKFYVNR